MKKIFIILIVVLIVFVGFINLSPNINGYKYITEDAFGKWYYNKSSVETRIDEETGAKIIDVWLKRDLNEDSIACGSDEVLWHLDIENQRYKASDTVAYDKSGQIIET